MWRAPESLREVVVIVITSPFRDTTRRLTATGLKPRMYAASTVRESTFLVDTGARRDGRGSRLRIQPQLTDA